MLRKYCGFSTVISPLFNVAGVKFAGKFAKSTAKSECYMKFLGEKFTTRGPYIVFQKLLQIVVTGFYNNKV